MKRDCFIHKLWHTQRVAVLLLAWLPLTTLMAQNDTTVYNESVIVVGDYKPVIQESFKLNVAPTITDTNTQVEHQFEYGISPQRLTAIFSPTRLGYVKIIEPPTRIYNNYLRLGMGGYWSPLADLYYHSTRNKKLMYGVRLMHEASYGKIGRAVDTMASPDFYGKAHYRNTDISAFGKYVIKEKHQVYTDLRFQNQYNLFYGFSDSTLNDWAHRTHSTLDSLMLFTHDSVAKSLYDMNYNYVAWSGGIRSLNLDVNQFGYEANLGVDALGGSYGMAEQRLAADWSLHYGFPMFKAYKGIAYLNAELEAFHNRYYPQFIDTAALLLNMPYAYQQPLVVDSMTDWSVYYRQNLYVDFLFGGFQFHAGLRMAMAPNADDTTKTTKFMLFPDVVVSKTLMHEAMNISLGATGDVDANSWNSIRLQNPYVGPAVMLRPTSHYDFFGHLRLSFNKKLELNARAEYTVLNDGLLFRLDSNYALHNVYTTYYRNYQRATVGASLTFVNDEMLSLDLGGNYYHYNARFSASDPEDYPPLLYTPKFDVHLTARINYKDKVIAHFMGLLIGPMQGDFVYDADNPYTSNMGRYQYTDTIALRAGINLQLEYIHNRALSFFVKFDNILAQRYFYWSNYPSHRFNATVGLTYTIPTKRH